MTRIGIDLGTTNSVVARDGRALLLPDDGRTTLPSVVAFLPNGRTQVGEPARRRRAIDSANTIFSSKRIIGRLFDSYETQNFRERYPFRIVETDGRTPAFETRAGVVTPAEVATLVLRALLERTGVEPRDRAAVLTVPAAFAEPQRRATAEAAEKAGLSGATLLDEPSATAWAYLAAGRECRRALVYDLGGGTFDCAVVECGDGVPRLASHASDLMLGGDDVDHGLAEWVARHVLEKHNWDLANYAEVYDRLLYRCEQAKIQLSRQDEVEIDLAQVDPECPAPGDSVTVTRAFLDRLCRPLVGRTFVACDGVLRQAGLHPRDIDRVFLAGGTTLLPFVQEGVRTYFGHRGLLDLDPTEVVAIGASRAEV
jgi:molecular chaperone DnaK